MDLFVARAVVCACGAISVLGVAGITGLAMLGHDIPASLVTITAGAFGTLVGIPIQPGHGHPGGQGK